MVLDLQSSHKFVLYIRSRYPPKVRPHVECASGIVKFIFEDAVLMFCFFRQAEPRSGGGTYPCAKGDHPLQYLRYRCIVLLSFFLTEDTAISCKYRHVSSEGVVFLGERCGALRPVALVHPSGRCRYLSATANFGLQASPH